MENIIENQINTVVRKFIIENFLFGSSENGLEDSDSFLEKGIIDSTGILELIAYLEEKYGIEIKDEEIVPENLDCIKSIVNFIRRKINQPGAAVAS